MTSKYLDITTAAIEGLFSDSVHNLGTLILTSYREHIKD